MGTSAARRSIESAISVVVPAYNEAATIAQTLGEMFAYFDDRKVEIEIIVAADGRDGTREIVRAMQEQHANLRLLDNPRRLGDMAAAMRRLARPNAADEVAKELIALASA